MTMPRMVIRQIIEGPNWRRKLVRRVWAARAEVYALDDRGHVATISASGEVRAVSKRSKLHGAVQVLIDHLSGCHANTVHVLAYGHAKEPFLVRLPIEPVGESTAVSE